MAKKISFPIIGMHCASCAKLIERNLSKTEGVIACSVNYASEQAMIECDENTDTQSLSQAVERAGYKAVISQDADEVKQKAKQEEIVSLKNKVIVSGILSIVIFVGMFINLPSILLLFLASIVQFWIGKDFYKATWSGLLNRTANMDTLIAMGTSVAFFYSAFVTIFPYLADQIGLPMNIYFDTSVVIITLIFMGRFLEARAKLHTSDAIKKLIGLGAKTARVIRNGKDMDVPITEVIEGDKIRVRPGEKIPVDGIILEGTSSIDQSMITGEAIPFEVGKGHKVIGATINKQGSFVFKATIVGSETMLNQIVQMVAQAQGSKAPIQRLADQISGYFVPIVLILSVVTFVVWYDFGSFPGALANMIAVLVIACPCALGLATPTAIMVGTGKAAQKGILIKDAQSLEIANKIKTIIFDKTGTLTEGKPEVTDIIPNSKILQISASLEFGSEHPLAEAVVQNAKEKKVKLMKATNFETISGKGITANIKGKKYLFGNKSLMKSQKIDLSKFDLKIDKLEKSGKTVMILADKKALGLVAAADSLKQSTQKTISRLKKNNINVWMITGDNRHTAEVVANDAGIENVLSEVLPGEKAKKVQELKKDIVAFVGDGINDAPALATADVGIAMGSGTDVAIETASITLLNKDLGSVVSAIELSRKTMKTIRQNLFWAFGYNAILIPVAMGILYPFFGVLLRPEFAAFAMAASSFSVVGNSLRLKTANI